MKNKFIPVNNDFDKAIAFANTFDTNNIRDIHHMNPPNTFINPLSVAEALQGEGWELQGVAEQRNKRRQVSSQYLRMQHPDLRVNDVKGHSDSVATIVISNQCNGAKPMNVDLGMFRQVCSNGMVARDEVSKTKIPHTEAGIMKLNESLQPLYKASQRVLAEVERMKLVDMPMNDIKKLAYDSIVTRYGENFDNTLVSVDDVINSRRFQDNSNDLFTVFNRIQENLTHDITNYNKDIKLNKELFELASVYAN
tara:strand:+ start:824 stop:1579 length:756 start_codon:yes stop_codon:yes gene_type:complete